MFTETPVNKLFVPSKHWDLLRPIALVSRIRWRFYNELKQTQKLSLELEYVVRTTQRSSLVDVLCIGWIFGDTGQCRHGNCTFVVKDAHD